MKAVSPHYKNLLYQIPIPVNIIEFKKSVMPWLQRLDIKYRIKLASLLLYNRNTNWKFSSYFIIASFGHYLVYLIKCNLLF